MAITVTADNSKKINLATLNIELSSFVATIITEAFTETQPDTSVVYHDWALSVNGTEDDRTGIEAVVTAHNPTYNDAETAYYSALNTTVNYNWLYGTYTTILNGQSAVGVACANIGEDAKIMYGRLVGAGDLGHISISIGADNFYFSSSSATDTSTVLYRVITSGTPPDPN